MTLLPTAGRDTGPRDTGPEDTGPEDTGPEDTGPEDTGPEDTGPEDTGGLWAFGERRVLIGLALGALLLQPAVKIALHGPRTGLEWFQLAGPVVLTGIVIWRISSAEAGDRRTQWASMLAIASLALALFVAGGPGWLATVAVAAGIYGRYTRARAPVIAAALAFSVTGLILATVHHYESGNVVAVLLIAPLSALFGYGRARRTVTLSMLRRTRAELARAAVAQERLRIARDLHDLLGHSLSLITLKAELAGRILGTDPDRAAREISELQSVARESLADVRGAVAGFRQPDLAGEIAAARQLLDAAGIAAQVVTTGTGRLPHDADAALAWAVREGATNVVRHSAATQVYITVSIGAAVAEAEIRDNGPVPGDRGGCPAPVPFTPPRPGAPGAPVLLTRGQPAVAGSGLAGLTERVRGLGGELTAGSAGGHGFLLRVSVPLRKPAGAGAAATMEA